MPKPSKSKQSRNALAATVFKNRTLMVHQTNPLLQLRLAGVLLFVLICIGTAGYVIIEKYPPFDALYMTVITLSTVGYGEVYPLHTAGRMFTILLIAVGVGLVGWAVSSTFAAFASEQGQRSIEKARMQRFVDNLSDHFIVCGYGRLGRAVVRNYLRSKVPFVVVDLPGPAIDSLRAEEMPFVEGDASEDQILKLAGIDRARALIAVTPTDSVNTFIVLSARELNADLDIVARADSTQNVPKLYRAGANKVISPHVLGGWWMAVTAVNPAVTDFVESVSESHGESASLHEFDVGKSLVGSTLSNADLHGQTGALILAIRRGHEYAVNPPLDWVFGEEDRLIALGNKDQISRMIAVCGPQSKLRRVSV